MNLTLGIFIIILLITLGITYWAAKRTSPTASFYAADSRLTAAEWLCPGRRLVQRRRVSRIHRTYRGRRELRRTGRDPCRR